MEQPTFRFVDSDGELAEVYCLLPEGKRNTYRYFSRRDVVCSLTFTGGRHYQNPKFDSLFHTAVTWCHFHYVVEYGIMQSVTGSARLLVKDPVKQEFHNIARAVHTDDWLIDSWPIAVNHSVAVIPLDLAGSMITHAYYNSLAADYSARKVCVPSERIKLMGITRIK